VTLSSMAMFFVWVTPPYYNIALPSRNSFP
jgi:hypothetical protein